MAVSCRSACGKSRQDWLRVMALVRLVTGAGIVVGDPESGDIVTVGNSTDIVIVIMIDLETMSAGLGEGPVIDPGHDLGPAVESYRRMVRAACIIPLVLDSDGVVLDQGRTVRLVAWVSAVLRSRCR